MEFEHDVHRDIHQKVDKYLSELFEEPYQDPDDGHFYVTYGSTVLEISVDPYGPEEAIVRLVAYCVQGVEVSENLERGLLETNLDLHHTPFVHGNVIPVGTRMVDFEAHVDGDRITSSGSKSIDAARSSQYGDPSRRSKCSARTRRMRSSIAVPPSAEVIVPCLSIPT